MELQKQLQNGMICIIKRLINISECLSFFINQEDNPDAESFFMICLCLVKN